MPKTLLKSLIASVLLLLAAPLASQASHELGYNKANPLIVGLDMDYAPLEYVNDDGIPSGYDVDFTKELMNRMNIAFTYQPNSWKNISGDVLKGKVDLGMMVYSPYRKELVNYSHAVFRLYYQVVFRSSDKAKFDVRNLSDKDVAYMSSRPIGDTLRKVGARLHVVEDLPHAMVELSEGKYDAVICFRYQARYIINTHRLNNLKSADLTLAPREYCYVSRNKQLIDSINVYLDQMEADGTIEAIYGEGIIGLPDFHIPRWIYYALAAITFVFLIYIVFMQQRHRKELMKEVKRAQRSEQMKTVFLGNVSHALRTPLNAVIGFSEVLKTVDKDDMSHEEHDNLVDLINKNGQQLLYFINELLQLSDFESNNTPRHIVKYDFSQLIAQSAKDIAPELKEGVELIVDNKPLTVNLDPELGRTVIHHLLTNAAKNTTEGHISVSYREEHHRLYVEVEDTGCGLPEALKDNIFELLNERETFLRSENPGLGLTICKSIIDRSGGKIGARSEAGKGTTIWLWVPIDLSSKKVDYTKK